MAETTAAARPKGPPGRQPRFTREQIVAAALGLLGRGGVESLNLRSLASELRMSPTGLYRYFDDKDDLLDAIVAGVLAPVASEPRDGSTRERLRDSMLELYDALVANPGVAELCALRFPGPRLDEVRSRLLAISGGSSAPDDDGEVLRALTSYVLGAALVAPARDGDRIGAPTKLSFEFGLEMLLRGMPERRRG